MKTIIVQSCSSRSPSVEIRAGETHDGVTINWTSNYKVASKEYEKLVKIQYSIPYIKFILTTIANLKIQTNN